MKTITALEAKQGDYIKFRKHGRTIFADVISTSLVNTTVRIEISMDSKNVSELTFGERVIPVENDWFEHFPASQYMTLIEQHGNPV